MVADQTPIRNRHFRPPARARISACYALLSPLGRPRRTTAMLARVSLIVQDLHRVVEATGSAPVDVFGFAQRQQRATMFEVGHVAIDADLVDATLRFRGSVCGWPFRAWGPPGFHRAELPGGCIVAIQQRREPIPGSPTTGVEATITDHGGRCQMDQVSSAGSFVGSVHATAASFPAGSLGSRRWQRWPGVDSTDRAAARAASSRASAQVSLSTTAGAPCSSG